MFMVNSKSLPGSQALDINEVNTSRPHARLLGKIPNVNPVFWKHTLLILTTYMNVKCVTFTLAISVQRCYRVNAQPLVTQFAFVKREDIEMKRNSADCARTAGTEP
ncbi:Hypothetical predicted protein [Pelobates cultripes]|uniref:Uncharacterized protein n=1 Tax=Pelobates cultripes TaxID=61616 RepID=A0AAD1WRY8_PELCU|nr:Hypothetical predicted protein [Pelobates cultripes]